MHGLHVRDEPKKQLAKLLGDLLKWFYFDTITHRLEALEFLVGSAGSDRVLLGSDHPFDMGMTDGVLQVKNLSIYFAGKPLILGYRARSLLGVTDRPAARAIGAE